GMGILLLGAVLMLFTRFAHPDFFKGRTLKRITWAPSSCWGMGILLLGAVLMLFTRFAHPDFFKGRTLKRIT
ncbi:amino acid transporter, partial [Bacteroides fragilis]|nr:amino acid transporter [Bacteroides fragilis]